MHTQVSLMLRSSTKAMSLTDKDQSYHPIESPLANRVDDARQRKAQLQMLAQQHAKVTLRRTIGEVRKVQTYDELQHALAPQSALFDDSSGPMHAKLVAHTRVVATSGDQRPVRLRSGSWWFEIGLDALPANASGQLRFGVMSDSLTESESAGYAIDFGPSKRPGRVEQLEWGARPTGKSGALQQTHLQCNAKHRIALALSFPHSESASSALAQAAPSWIEPSGHFDEIEVGRRVVIADSELCEELFANASQPWTEMHNYYCGRTGRARTGVVHSLSEPVVREDGTKHVMACHVKLDAAQSDGKGVLTFLPGCVLDAPERQLKSRASENGCLSLYLREGDKGATVKLGNHPIYALPADLPLKPFIEWVSADRDEKQGITLSVRFFEAHFELRESPLFAPIASAEMMRAQRLEASPMAKIAAEHIKKVLVAKVQRKFILNLYRKVQQRAEAQGQQAPEDRQKEVERLLIERKSAMSDKAVEAVKRRKELFNTARGAVLKSIKKMMVRDKNGVLVPTPYGKDIIRGRRLAKGSVSEASMHDDVAEKHDNVSHMLGGFENDRLARGGFWDWEDHQGGASSAAAKAAEAAAGGGTARKTAGNGEAAAVLTNADLYRAAQLPGGGANNSGGGAVTVRMQGGSRDLGELTFAAPPNRSEEKWLIDCVMLFREALDLSLIDVVPNPQPYAAPPRL